MRVLARARCWRPADSAVVRQDGGHETAKTTHRDVVLVEAEGAHRCGVGFARRTAVGGNLHSAICDGVIGPVVGPARREQAGTATFFVGSAIGHSWPTRRAARRLSDD